MNKEFLSCETANLINNKLAVVLGNSQLAQRNLSADGAITPVLEKLLRVDEAVKQIAELVNSLAFGEAAIVPE